MAAAVQSRFRQPTFAGAAVAARMRSTRARTVHALAISSPRRRPPHVLHEIEQNLRVRQPVFEDFERAGVADDFGQFRQPGELPPGERTEPEHRAIERGQQQHIEIAVGDVGAFMGEHGPALRRIPVAALRRQQDGRSERDRPADHVAHAHAPARPSRARCIGFAARTRRQVR